MKFKVFLQLTFLLLGGALYAQNSYSGLFPTDVVNASFLTGYKIKNEDNNTFYLDFQNQNFFKNDEYFSDLTSGLTYIGYHLCPTVQYQPHSKLRLSLGVSALNFSGLDGFHKVLPIYAINYQPVEGVNILMGALNGGFNHGLHEALYASEYAIMRPLENGVQVLIDKWGLKADIWVDWQHFIFKNAGEQEEIVGGSHFNYRLLEWRNYNLCLDYQPFVYHKGGQYSAEGQQVQSLINSSIGIDLIRYTADVTTKNDYWGLQFKYFTYNNVANFIEQPYSKGWASSSALFFSWEHLKMNLAYWYAHHFISSQGQGLLMSVSELYKSFVKPNSQVLSMKLAWQQKVYSDLLVEVRFEPYFDIDETKFNYSYSLNMIFNSRFFLWKKGRDRDNN